MSRTAAAAVTPAGTAGSSPRPPAGIATPETAGGTIGPKFMDSLESSAVEQEHSPRERLPGSQSARRLLDILALFNTDQPVHSIDDLAAGAGVPRSTVYRFVALLREYDLLEPVGDGDYQLGPRAVTMGYVARSAVDLAHLWRPVLEHLVSETNETAHILRRVGNFAVCVDQMESAHPVRPSFEIGRTTPLHQRAAAKVLLAFSSDGFRRRYLADVVPAPARQPLQEELARIVDAGFGESEAEVDPGIWATAAPLCAVGGDPPLVLSLAVPDYRLDDARRAQLRILACDAASSLRHLMRPYAS